MMSDIDSQYGADYLAYQRDRSMLRRVVRRFYLKNIASRVKGDAVDFGCGSGELLSLLSPGSMGLDVNPVAVAYCRQERGLKAILSTGEDTLSQVLKMRMFGTFIMSHVLEHLEEPAAFLAATMQVCVLAGVERMIFVVPGRRGFASDSTHKVFIEQGFFLANTVHAPYAVVHCEHFPINMARAGDWFTHNELVVVLDRQASSRSSE